MADKLEPNDLKYILMALINRQRLNYTFRDIMHYILACICFRNVRENKKKSEFKKHYLYQKCQENLNQELDVVNLLKQSRQIKILT